MPRPRDWMLDCCRSRLAAVGRKRQFVDLDMAEGMLGGILGDEDDKQEVSASAALAGTDGFAAAVEAP